MARKNQSVIEDLIDLISYLPWWVGASLAPVSYFLLHAYALKETPQAANMQDLSAVIIPGVLHVFALFGQYIIPFALILGAMTSAYNQFVRRKLHDKVSQSPMKDVLNDMSWHQFEMLVGEMYRQQGYQVKELGGSGPDGGADLVLTKYGKTVKNSPIYVTPLLKNAVNLTYEYQGWRIRAAFINGHAVRMAYSKLPKPKTTQVISPEEMDAILSAEVHGGKWEKGKKKFALTLSGLAKNLALNSKRGGHIQRDSKRICSRGTWYYS